MCLLFYGKKVTNFLAHHIRQGVCSPDLMGKPASAFQGAVYTNAVVKYVVIAGFCLQNPNSENDAWLLS